MIYEIDDRFPTYGRWKYKGQSIREVLLTDSGYIKDLIMKREAFSLSDKCIDEAIFITKGNRDTWKKPDNPINIFEELKPYAVPYGFDFNNEELQRKNKENRNGSCIKL